MRANMTIDDLPIREPYRIRQDCARKLHAVHISDHFQTIPLTVMARWLP